MHKNSVALSMATIEHANRPSSEPAVYFVYTENPGQNREAYYLRILTSALGSTNAAKESLVYSYFSFDGFAAKLTPQEAAIVQIQPGVTAVIPDTEVGHGDGPTGRKT